MPDFSISIVTTSNGTEFEPDLPEFGPGDPLYCAPSSIVSWANHTSVPHTIQTDDKTFTTEQILPELSNKTEYVTPTNDGQYGYHCTEHAGETGTIIVQAVTNIGTLGVAGLFAALAMTVFSALPARAQQKTTPAPTPAPTTSQIKCLPDKQPLIKIPEVVSSNGRLRATIVTTAEQVRMPTRYPLTFVINPNTNPPQTQASQPGDPQTYHACFPEWVRAFRSPDTTTPWPGMTAGYLDPMNGPTLRARVGDFVELTFRNDIDPTKWGNSIDRGDEGACDSTSAGYPGSAKDTFPNCFHGSTSANMHFHGTHTNPNSTGDNIFVEVLSSKRLTGTPAPPPPPSFDDWFAKCEEHLNLGSHVQWPTVWEDLPDTYRTYEHDLLTRFDQQPNIGDKLWPVNQELIDKKLWPQYFISAYPTCFKLPKYPEATAAPMASGKEGSNEMQAHHGMEMPAVIEQGGPLRMGQAPGTHWYHAHKHGSTTIDLYNGFAGALIIEGQYDDEISDFYKAFAPAGQMWTRTQPVLVVNEFGTSPNLKGGAVQDKGPDFEVNGRVNPVISMRPGEVQMWRIVNTSARSGTYFSGPPAGFHWRRLATDGVQLANENYKRNYDMAFLLAAGNRMDVLVQAPSTPCTTKGGCMYPVQVNNEVDPSDLQPNTPPKRGPFKIDLMTVNVSGTAVNMPLPDETPAKTFPTFLSDVTAEEVHGNFKQIDFGTAFVPGSAQMSINGKKFSHDVGVVVKMNTSEEWTVTNNTVGISHPFHIHINPFQLTQIFAPASATFRNGTPIYTTTPPAAGSQQCYLNPDDPTTWVPCAADPDFNIPQPRIWWDVFPIPSALTATNSKGQSVNIPGFFKMRSRFVDYNGFYVIHCHILAHEDRGMMTIVEVTPVLSQYSHH